MRVRRQKRLQEFEYGVDFLYTITQAFQEIVCTIIQALVLPTKSLHCSSFAAIQSAIQLHVWNFEPSFTNQSNPNELQVLCA